MAKAFTWGYQVFASNDEAALRRIYDGLHIAFEFSEGTLTIRSNTLRRMMRTVKNMLPISSQDVINRWWNDGTPVEQEPDGYMQLVYEDGYLNIPEDVVAMIIDRLFKRADMRDYILKLDGVEWSPKGNGDA